MLHTILLKKRLKQYYRQEFLKCTFLPAELERGTEMLQFDVCCKAIDQNFCVAVIAAQSVCVWTRYYGLYSSLLLISQNKIFTVRMGTFLQKTQPGSSKGCKNSISASTSPFRPSLDGHFNALTRDPKGDVDYFSAL